MSKNWDFLKTPLLQIQQNNMTLISLLGAVLFILGAFLVSRLLQGIFKRKLFPRLALVEGQQYTILRLTHYLIIFIGLVIGLELMGLDLSSFAVVAGLFSVGIGFGLQNVVSNLIAGIILLFEQPIKVGDRITIGELHGDVYEINIRSTTVLTQDNIAIIVPNSDFINGRVTNWSYEDPTVRLHIPLRVSYGSDIDLVARLLLQAAQSHVQVLKSPEPQVIFKAFGESALQFELEIWVAQAKEGGHILSDLHHEIHRLFKNSGIDLPYPKQEIHLKSSSGTSPLP